MKFLTLLSTLFILMSGTAAHAEDPIAGIVTCKTTKPDAKRSDYLAVSDSCQKDKLQAACDDYKDDPYYGPAKVAFCTPQYNLAKLQGTLKKEFAFGRRFPGTPSSITLCKTKAEGKIYAKEGETCDLAEQQKNCDSFGKDIATPTSCAIYTSQDWFENQIQKNPLTSGIECQISGSGVPFRLAVPDCSANLKNSLCDPSAGKVLSCKQWSDPNALKAWAEAIPMTGAVSCRVNALPQKIVGHIPARDCSLEAQRDACGVWGTPTGCKILDIERIRQQLLLQDQQQGK